jgi:hypothetical protein
MTRIVMKLTLTVAPAALALTGCFRIGDASLKREAVLPLLQQEAQSLKRDGEKVDPKLPVRTTWNIEAVEVKEQPDNADNPWTGTIHFKIESRMQEVDGTTLTQNFDKRFEYVYSAALKRWIIQYVPPSPAPRS